MRSIVLPGTVRSTRASVLPPVANATAPVAVARDQFGALVLRPVGGAR